MMLPAQGPTTSLMEDLNALGMVEGQDAPASKSKQVKRSDKEGGDYAGPPGKAGTDPGGATNLDTGDDAAGDYICVPVRADGNVGPEGQWGKSRGGAKNEDYEEVSVNGKMLPSFMIPPTPSEDAIAEEEEKFAEQATKAQLHRAWEVINSYFSEDDDGLNESGLRGVINAMGHALNVAVEDIAMLQTENVRLTEAVNDLNGLLKEAEEGNPFGGKQAPPFGSKPGKMDDEEDEDSDEDEDEDEAEAKSKKLPPWMQKKEEARRGGNLMEDASLNSILDEVAAIGGSQKQQALNAQSKLIEAFEDVLSSSSDILDRVVGVIREDEGLAEDEELDLPDSDARLKVAQFFYGIAEDAQNYLGRLADGDVSFRVAEEDLSRLHSDIQKGINAMHEIPS